jgi:hypothetical protein
MAKLLDVEVDPVERGVDASEKAIIDAYVARCSAEAAVPSSGQVDSGDPDVAGDLGGAVPSILTLLIVVDQNAKS